jgi:hypothetical protein
MKRSQVVQTFQLLLDTFPGLAEADRARIKDEFDELLRVRLIDPERRRMLLEVVHSCRALESTLDAILVSFAIVIPDRNKSLGRFLSAFASSAVVGPKKLSDKIDPFSRTRYQEFVAQVRNNMMHRAGAYPKSRDDLDGFMGVLHEWLSHLLALS